VARGGKQTLTYWNPEMPYLDGIDSLSPLERRAEQKTGGRVALAHTIDFLVSH